MSNNKDFNVKNGITVEGGNITLNGTGRIQGIDTVSAGTDAASKTYVDTAVANLVASAPAALDTLNELAAALGNDASFSTTVTNALAAKAPLTGTGASGTWSISITGNAGTVTNGIYTTTNFGGDVSGTYNAIVVADDSHSHAFNNLTSKTSGTGTYTTSGDFRAPIFYDSDNTVYYFDGSSLSRTNQLTRRNSRVNTSEEYPLGHHSAGETVFEIDPTWSETELRNYFNTSSVSWVADSTAPGGYAISVSGAVNVGGEYTSGFPFIPVDQDDIFYMEIWVKGISGTANHYVGSNEYNESFASLGGNPGSYGYWVMQNNAPGATWTKYAGYITGFGNSLGQFESGTKYFTPMALFNYSGGTSYISGWKIIKVSQAGNRTIIGKTGSQTDNSTYALDVYHPTSYRQLRVRAPGDPLIKLSGSYNGGNGGEFWQNSSGFLVFNINSITAAFSAGGNNLRTSVYYDVDNTGYYLDPNSTSVLNTPTALNGISAYDSAWGNDPYGKIGVTRGTDANYSYFGLTRAGQLGMGMGIDTSNQFWIGGTTAGYSGTRSSTWFIMNTSGDTTSASSSRAPIFYDSNNTSYYVDAASESVFSTLTLMGELNLSASSINYIDHTGTIYFRNQSGYATSATLTTGGDFTASGNVTAYSDARLKDNVETVSDALGLVSAMRGVIYTRKDTGQAGVGVIAQEMLEVIPQVVQQSEDGTLSVAYGNLVGVLIEAIKDQQSQITALEAKVEAILAKLK